MVQEDKEALRQSLGVRHQLAISNLTAQLIDLQRQVKKDSEQREEEAAARLALAQDLQRALQAKLNIKNEMDKMKVIQSHDNSEKDMLVNKLANAEKSMREMETDFFKKQRELEASKREAENTIVSLQGEISDLTKVLEKRENDIDDLRADLRTKKTENANYAVEIANLQQQLAQTQFRLERALNTKVAHNGQLLDEGQNKTSIVFVRYPLKVVAIAIRVLLKFKYFMQTKDPSRLGSLGDRIQLRLACREKERLANEVKNHASTIMTQESDLSMLRRMKVNLEHQLGGANRTVDKQKEDIKDYQIKIENLNKLTIELSREKDRLNMELQTRSNSRANSLAPMLRRAKVFVNLQRLLGKQLTKSIFRTRSLVHTMDVGELLKRLDEDKLQIAEWVQQTSLSASSRASSPSVSPPKRGQASLMVSRRKSVLNRKSSEEEAVESSPTPLDMRAAIAAAVAVASSSNSTAAVVANDSPSALNTSNIANNVAIPRNIPALLRSKGRQWISWMRLHRPDYFEAFDRLESVEEENLRHWLIGDPLLPVHVVQQHQKQRWGSSSAGPGSLGMMLSNFGSVPNYDLNKAESSESNCSNKSMDSEEVRSKKKAKLELILSSDKPHWNLRNMYVDESRLVSMICQQNEEDVNQLDKYIFNLREQYNVLFKRVQQLEEEKRTQRPRVVRRNNESFAYYNGSNESRAKLRQMKTSFMHLIDKNDMGAYLSKMIETIDQVQQDVQQEKLDSQELVEANSESADGDQFSPLISPQRRSTNSRSRSMMRRAVGSFRGSVNAGNGSFSQASSGSPGAQLGSSFSELSRCSKSISRPALIEEDEEENEEKSKPMEDSEGNVVPVNDAVISAAVSRVVDAMRRSSMSSVRAPLGISAAQLTDLPASNVNNAVPSPISRLVESASVQAYVQESSAAVKSPVNTQTISNKSNSEATALSSMVNVSSLSTVPSASNVPVLITSASVSSTPAPASISQEPVTAADEEKAEVAPNKVNAVGRSLAPVANVSVGNPSMPTIYNHDSVNVSASDGEKAEVVPKVKATAVGRSLAPVANGSVGIPSMPTMYNHDNIVPVGDAAVKVTVETDDVASVMEVRNSSAATLPPSGLSSKSLTLDILTSNVSTPAPVPLRPSEIMRQSRLMRSGQISVDELVVNRHTDSDAWEDEDVDDYDDFEDEELPGDDDDIEDELEIAKQEAMAMLKRDNLQRVELDAMKGQRDHLQKLYDTLQHNSVTKIEDLTQQLATLSKAYEEKEEENLKLREIVQDSYHHFDTEIATKLGELERKKQEFLNEKNRYKEKRDVATQIACSVCTIREYQLYDAPSELPMINPMSNAISNQYCRDATCGHHYHNHGLGNYGLREEDTVPEVNATLTDALQGFALVLAPASRSSNQPFLRAQIPAPSSEFKEKENDLTAEAVQVFQHYPKSSYRILYDDLEQSSSNDEDDDDDSDNMEIPKKEHRHLRKLKSSKENVAKSEEKRVHNKKSSRHRPVNTGFVEHIIAAVNSKGNPLPHLLASNARDFTKPLIRKETVKESNAGTQTPSADFLYVDDDLQVNDNERGNVLVTEQELEPLGEAVPSWLSSNASTQEKQQIPSTLNASAHFAHISVSLPRTTNATSTDPPKQLDTTTPNANSPSAEGIVKKKDLQRANSTSSKEEQSQKATAFVVDKNRHFLQYAKQLLRNPHTPASTGVSRPASVQIRDESGVPSSSQRPKSAAASVRQKLERLTTPLSSQSDKHSNAHKSSTLQQRPRTASSGNNLDAFQLGNHVVAQNQDAEELLETLLPGQVPRPVSPSQLQNTGQSTKYSKLKQFPRSQSSKPSIPATAAKSVNANEAKQTTQFRAKTDANSAAFLQAQRWVPRVNDNILGNTIDMRPMSAGAISTPLDMMETYYETTRSTPQLFYDAAQFHYVDEDNSPLQAAEYPPLLPPNQKR
jgi:hypothetical protein